MQEQEQQNSTFFTPVLHNQLEQVKNYPVKVQGQIVEKNGDQIKLKTSASEDSNLITIEQFNEDVEQNQYIEIRGVVQDNFSIVYQEHTLLGENFDISLAERAIQIRQHMDQLF